MNAKDLKRDDIIRAPWREFGDDINLTGVVIGKEKRGTVVRWNGDGDVTGKDVESIIVPMQAVELVLPGIA